MHPSCESCGSETNNRVKAACDHLCYICKECLEACPELSRDECPGCQEHEDTVNVRGRFDDGLYR